MDEDDRRDYEDRYISDRGFELTMIRARRRCAIELMASMNPESVLEIGCGTDPLYEHAAKVVPSLRRWVIVEPGERFASIAEQQPLVPAAALDVVRGPFESRTGEVAEALGGSPDVVLCLGVLQGVEDPRGWLALLRSTLPPGASLVVTVANANSLHRRLARAMGLIEDEHELSARDRSASHRTVFDACSLREAVEASGFEIRDEGGYLLKPFTHAQMAQIDDVLPDAALDGLWTLGRELPELASEIYVVADAA